MDTEVFGADLVPGARLAAVYEPIIVGRPAFISFQTAAELRYGALRRTWGDARMRKLEARTNESEVVLSPSARPPTEVEAVAGTIAAHPALWARSRRIYSFRPGGPGLPDVGPDQASGTA